MNSRNIFLGSMIVTVGIAMIFGMPVVGAQTDIPVDANPVEAEAQAMAVLNRMTEFLSTANRFSVTVDSGFDAMQESGKKIEFGETREIVLRRPDRFRVDEVKRNGSTRQLFFDGENISVFHAKGKVYASVVNPGSIDDALDYFVHDLGMRLPLSELLSSQVATHLRAKIRSAVYVESSSIAGIPCDHVVFSGDEVDMQLWVARGEKPLPQRVVITYRHSDGQPQFRAQFRDWDLAPKTPDALFLFTPPRDAKKIAFSPRQKMPNQSPGAREGGKQ
jgi:hypothetical protein